MPETTTPQNQQGVSIGPPAPNAQEFQSLELGLLEHHRRNLRDRTYFTSEDGYVTTIRTMGVTVDDKYYMIPSYVGGKTFLPTQRRKSLKMPTGDFMFKSKMTTRIGKSLKGRRRGPPRYALLLEN